MPELRNADRVADRSLGGPVIRPLHTGDMDKLRLFAMCCPGIYILHEAGESSKRDGS